MGKPKSYKWGYGDRRPFFFSSLIFSFSRLRFFSVLTANVTLFFLCEFVWVTCVGIYSCCLSLCGGGWGSSDNTETICQGPCPGRAALRLLVAPLLRMEKILASFQGVRWRRGMLLIAQNCWLIWPVTGLVVPLLVPLVLHQHP